MIIFDFIKYLFKCWSKFEFSTSMLLFILSCSKSLSNKVIANRFVVVEEILFR